MEMLGITGVASIAIICYVVGMIVNATKIDNKYIPIVCGLCGILFGLLALCGGVPGFPAEDYLTAAAVGAVSGLAATGADQVFKQLM